MFFRSSGKAEPSPEDAVVLTPVFGVRPGIYLAALYGLIILLVLSALLILPGLLRPGSRIELRSAPRGAAVRMDGAYIGTTPCAVFVARGDHEFVFVLPGFTERSERLAVGSRLAGSLFWPRRERIELTLDSADPIGALAAAASEFAAWSFAGEPAATYQIPLVLSEAAYRLAGLADSAELTPILAAAARYADNPALLRDLVRSVFLVDSGGAAGGPVNLVRGAGAILRYLNDAPGASAWLNATLPESAAALVQGSTWSRTQTARAAAIVAGSGNGATGRTVAVGPLSFLEIAAGSLVPAGSWPRRLEIGRFWIADREVDAAAWEAFLAAEPEWAAENADSLAAAGLVDAGYLAEATDPAYPFPSQSGVSWHAAQAFCAWLTTRLPASLSAWRIRLPTEAEWDRAAGLDLGPAVSLAGGLWEWCADEYAPLDFLPEPAAGVRGPVSPQRSLRGGSWANAAKLPAGTRAALEPDTCALFIGFRPVIALPEAAAP